MNFPFSSRPNNTALRTILTPFYTKINSKRLLLKYIPANGKKWRFLPYGVCFCTWKKSCFYHLSKRRCRGFFWCIHKTYYFLLLRKNVKKEKSSISFFPFNWTPSFFKTFVVRPLIFSLQGSICYADMIFYGKMKNNKKKNLYIKRLNVQVR